MRFRIFVTLLVLMLAISNAIAQGESSDFFRSIGKMYVVVAVLVATFIGIVLFLIYIDRKISKIENEISSHE